MNVEPLWRDRRAWGLGGLAVLTYLPGLGWGLPFATSDAGIRGWDVDAIIGIGVLAEFHNLLVEAKADWFVAYPLFHYLLLGACYAPYLAWLWLTGGMSAPTGGYPYGLADPVTSIATFALIGRSLTTLMAVGTVLAVYRAARIVWDPRAGVMTGLLVMLSGPMVYLARTGNLDVPTLFWTSLGVLVLAHASVRGLSIRRAALIGVFAALSTATKDQAYGGWTAVILLLILLHWRRLLPTGESSGIPSWAAPAAMILGGRFVYVLASGIPVWPQRYLAHMHFILGYEEARFAFEELDLQRSRDLRGLSWLSLDFAKTVIAALGPAIVLIAGAGAFSTRNRPPFHGLLAAMLVGYLGLVIVPIAHMQFRYALLPCFLLAFPAGAWFSGALQGSAVRRRTAIVLGALGFAWLVVNAGNLTYQMWFDARYPAGEWLAANVSPGARIGFFGDKGQLPAVPEGVIVERLAGGSESLEELRRAPVDVVLVIPDYTAPAGGERSLFLSAAAHRALAGGTLPYVLAARFETPAPWSVRYPFVNPPVSIFVRREP
ncbi:MAG: ArnT family glycosyltransferase [Gammaproteobacteria bacterium]